MNDIADPCLSCRGQGIDQELHPCPNPEFRFCPVCDRGTEPEYDPAVDEGVPPMWWSRLWDWMSE